MSQLFASDGQSIGVSASATSITSQMKENKPVKKPGTIGVKCRNNLKGAAISVAQKTESGEIL